jgi:putative membrane protein
MPRSLLLAAALFPLSFMAGAAAAQSAASSEFIAKARATDAFEMEAGRIAERRSANADVKAFGAMMVKDHTDTTNALEHLLAKAKLPMDGKPTPNPTQAKILADLRSAPKKDFDRAYVHSQVSAHEEALKLMKAYGSQGDNADLRDAANKTAPMVEHHLDVARDLEFKVGGTSTGAARKIDG